MADEVNRPSPSAPTPPDGLMDKLEYYFVTKAPFQVPTGAKEWLVKYLPWISIIILVLLAPAILLALGLGSLVLPLSGLAGASATAGLSIAIFALAIQVVLMVAALPGLFARKRSGWNLEFYGSVFSLAYGLLQGNILGGIVGAVISFYILFQIRSYYR